MEGTVLVVSGVGAAAGAERRLLPSTVSHLQGGLLKEGDQFEAEERSENGKKTSRSWSEALLMAGRDLSLGAEVLA